MRKYRFTLLFMVALSMFCSCSKDDNGSDTPTPPTPPEEKPTAILKDNIQGRVETYPFNDEYKITISDLSPNMALTGRYFNADTNGRHYSINSAMEYTSKYAEFEAEYNSSYYKQRHSTYPKFKCITNIEDKDEVNVNILTHLEYERVKTLCKNGLAFDEAKKQAEKELLAVFGIAQEIPNPEKISLTDNNDNAKIMLAVYSVLLDGNLYSYTDTANYAKAYKLCTKISTDLGDNGKIDDKDLLSAIKQNKENCHPSKVVEYIKNCYKEQGKEIELPDFTKFVDFNGDGVIDEKDKETIDDTPNISVDYTYERIRGAIGGAYYYTSNFINSQLSVESIRLGKVQYDGISPYSSNIYETWNEGYRTVNILNLLEAELNDNQYDNYLHTFLTDVYALKAFVYYNMAMLWGNIPLIKSYQGAETGMNVEQVPASEVYAYCQELLGRCDLSQKVEEGRFDSDAIKLLMAEIALTQKDKAKALEYIYRISDVNKNIFAFNSENGTIPVYTKNFTTLLKEEVEGKANSQAWYNLGAEYGVWAALKRQGAAETLTKCKHHELLMPIPQSELNANPNIKQNTGY